MVYISSVRFKIKHLIESNQDIDIFNARQHKQTKELQIKPKNAFLNIHMIMHIFLPHPRNRPPTKKKRSYVSAT